MEDQMTDNMPEMGDLWNDDDELFNDMEDIVEDAFANVPSVRILLPGRAPIDVPLPMNDEGVPAATVRYVLDQANVGLRAGNTDVYVDGAAAGLDTVVTPGNTVAPVAPVKGG
jgi:hypothetical protein